jgi:type IV pilus assembly protein PilW
MKAANRHYPTAMQNSRGFSLVELMIALVITLILIAGIGQIFVSSKKSFTIQDSLARQQENGRYAIELIAQDLRRAGYFGGTAIIPEIIGTQPPIDADTGTGESFTCPTGDNTWGRMIYFRIFGINDARTNYACIPASGAPNGYLRGDVLVVRYGSPFQVGGTTVEDFVDPDTGEGNNRLYLRNTVFQGRIFNGSEQGNSENQVETVAATRESVLVAHAYYIGDSGRECRGQTVPSLFRVTLSNDGTPEVEEIAYGIDQLQVRYGVDEDIDIDGSLDTTPEFIDPDGDNLIDAYLDANKINNDDSPPFDSVPHWRQVVATKVWLITRAECGETGLVNNQTYADLGDVDYAVNDDFRRQRYQTTVFLRNLNITDR